MSHTINISAIDSTAKVGTFSGGNDVFVKRKGCVNPATGRLIAQPWNTLIKGDEVSVVVVFEDASTAFMQFEVNETTSGSFIAGDICGSKLINLLATEVRKIAEKPIKGINILLGEKQSSNSNEGNDEIPF